MILPNDKDLTLRYPLHTVDSSACLLRDTSTDVMTFVFTNILCYHICIVVPCGFSFHSFLSFFEYLQPVLIYYMGRCLTVPDGADLSMPGLSLLELRELTGSLAETSLGTAALFPIKAIRPNPQITGHFSAH